jgi:hypothetical protein
VAGRRRQWRRAGESSGAGRNWCCRAVSDHGSRSRRHQRSKSGPLAAGVGGFGRGAARARPRPFGLDELRSPKAWRSECSTSANGTGRGRLRSRRSQGSTSGLSVEAQCLVARLELIEPWPCRVRIGDCDDPLLVRPRLVTDHVHHAATTTGRRAPASSTWRSTGISSLDLSIDRKAWVLDHWHQRRLRRPAL